MRVRPRLGFLLLLLWVSVASAQTPPPPVISPAGWTLVSVDSEEPGGTYAATKAFDGNPATFWHTVFSAQTPPLPPHTLTLNLGTRYAVTGFRILPRQDGIANGRIGQYELATSLDNQTWTTVQTGVLANVATAQEVVVTPTVAQFVRLRALSEVNGLPYTAVAELTLLGTPAIWRLTWSQSAPPGVLLFSAADAAAQTYRLYVAGIGSVLAGVTCGDTADPVVKACQAPVPASVGPGVALELTASITGADESARSAPPVQITSPAATPLNVRVVQK